MVLETLAVLSGVKGLFMYNRQSYSFNKTLDQERLYHLQKMRIEQIKLYRDDIRDLFELVVGKMDNYYLINTLSLGFSLALYYEGKIPTDVPSWLFWLWAMSLGSAIVCLFLSVWFAVHASVIAQMFSARILTQWLRLPVPSPDQIDAGAPRLEEFEKAPVNQQLRVPVINASKKVVVGQSVEGGSNDPATTSDPLIHEGYNYYMGHFYMFTRLQKHWMSLDAYCRVCMVLGCNQILNAVTYTALGYFSLFDYQWGSIAFIVVPIVFACIHAHINLLLTKKEAVLFLLVHSLAPLLAGVAAGVQMVYTISGEGDEGATLGQAIALGSYVCHFLSSLFLLYLGLELQNGLPIRFTAVNYIDVLGMQKSTDSETTKETTEGGIESIAAPLKQSRSARLSGLFTVESSVVSAEKAQPPIEQLVPAAESVRQAEKMYQSLVQKKVGSRLIAARTGSRLIRSSSAPHMTKGLSFNEPVVEAAVDEIPPSGVFATQLPATRGTVRLVNELFETRALRRTGSSALIGPKDYAPTAAQLHAPDVLSRMPELSFRMVGITMLILWFAGIVFGAISVSGAVDIGWVNVVVASSNVTVISSAEEGHLRRLSETIRRPAPARFLTVDTAECGTDGSVFISDSTSKRSFLLTPHDGGYIACEDEAARCARMERVAASPRVVGKEQRSFLLELAPARQVEVSIPSNLFRGGDIYPRFLWDWHGDRVFGSIQGVGILRWSALTGQFEDIVNSPCNFSLDSNPALAICGSDDGAIIVFQKGDSCIL